MHDQASFAETLLHFCLCEVHVLKRIMSTHVRMSLHACDVFSSGPRFCTAMHPFMQSLERSSDRASDPAIDRALERTGELLMKRLSERSSERARTKLRPNQLNWTTSKEDSGRNEPGEVDRAKWTSGEVDLYHRCEAWGLVWGSESPVLRHGFSGRESLILQVLLLDDCKIHFPGPYAAT